LFIDEAYALTSSNSSSDFGKEAVDTLLKRMEDDRGKFLVIAAGYTNEMKDFVASNPGIKSRFTKTFHFEDYTPEELMKITNFSVDKLKLELTKDADDALFKHFSILHLRRDKHFGNARIVRNLLEKIKKKQLLRIADESNKEDINKIILQDIEEFLEKEKVAQKFDNPKEDPLKIILDNLDSLVGHKKIKLLIQKQIKLLQVTKLRAERGLKFMNKNLNSLFIGNSGSGKSTIANYLGKIYKELNYLKSGHVIEVKGSELLVADSEQARNKIETYINQALDGILFLENLSPLFENNQSGELVLENLSNLYDKYIGRLVIVISGSRDEMEMFSLKRDAFKLQFKDILIFDDYSPRELLSITADLAIDNNYILDEGALQIILDL
ncbi:MAG: AAA family ATPase, partial [Melioribacteraceae bacterium]|nr:AAA family ATPase [Melioribacteraceae bacterium]